MKKVTDETATEEKLLTENSVDEVVDNSEPLAPVIDMASLEELVKEKATKLEEYKKANDDLMKKSYPVEYDAEKLDRLDAFYIHNVKWKYNQALGVVEVKKAIDKIKGNLSTGKGILPNGFRFKGLTVQAICYHLSEYEAVGYAAANDFLENLYKPFNETLKLVNSDANAIQKLAQDIDGLDLKIASVQQGVPVEKTPTRD